MDFTRCGLKAVSLIHSWGSVDVGGRLYALFYPILYKGREHLQGFLEPIPCFGELKLIRGFSTTWGSVSLTPALFVQGSTINV